VLGICLGLGWPAGSVCSAITYVLEGYSLLEWLFWRYDVILKERGMENW